MIERTNPDDIFLRGATIAVMNYLSNSLVIEQVENNDIVEYPIPVFYNKAQDSQFMRDYFTDYATLCHGLEYADGDFDREPFAIVSLESFAVKMSDMTNKFVRGNHIQTVKDDNGYDVKKGYNSVLYLLPMQLKYNVEIRTEDTIQSFRVTQSILDGVFKNNVVHFDFRHQRIRCNASLDASFTHDKKVDFTYNDDQSQKIRFTIDLECYYPVFDKTTTIFRGNVIRNFREYIDGQTELLEKGTVTDKDGNMKTFETTQIISKDEAKELVKKGYEMIENDGADTDPLKKDPDLSVKGPYIIVNKEYVFVKNNGSSTTDEQPDQQED